MQVGTGISILNGIAIGKIKIFKAPTYEISDSLVEDPIPELDRYEKANSTQRCSTMMTSMIP